MYSEEHKLKMSNILNAVGEFLDIPESKWEEAERRYKSVGKWLDETDSELHQYSPLIYSQGSFRLGTMIRPLSDKEEYDIDLVCLLQKDKQSTTQKDLKDMVGDRLKENEKYKRMLEDGRRCWTLTYANEFHMDILPAIPDSSDPAERILITDKELRLWQHSNPIGYANWFRSRMAEIFLARRQKLAESIQASIEDVPEYKVKTPLQRVVQLLKRHRDIYFSGKDFKPISIIITTLAGHAYRNEANLFDALSTVIPNMGNYIVQKDGQYYVLNPTNENENFADKWNEDPTLPKGFFAWLKKLKQDFDNVLSIESESDILESLKPLIGTGVVTAISRNFISQTSSPTPHVVISNPNRPWRMG